MKKNDWLPGFIIGLALIMLEVGYWVQFTGINNTVSNWVQQKTILTMVAKK